MRLTSVDLVVHHLKHTQIYNLERLKPMNDKLITPVELAEYLHTTVPNLAQLRYLGKGPAFIKAGRSIRYRESDVQAWLDENTRTQTGSAA